MSKIYTLYRDTWILLCDVVEILHLGENLSFLSHSSVFCAFTVEFMCE